MFLWDVLFPARCLVCGRLGAYVCVGCSGKMKPTRTQTCLYCGKSSLYGLTHPACHRANGVDGRISLYRYDNILKRVIAGIKYRLVRGAFPDLFYIVAAGGCFLTGAMRVLHPDVFVPIPQSSRRQNERGFNQARILAGMFSRLLGVPVADLLIKPKHTPPQASLPDRSLRRGAQKGVFAVAGRKSVPGRIVLVDDVVTSGETVREAALVLKRQGAQRVYVLSVAKG